MLIHTFYSQKFLSCKMYKYVNVAWSQALIGMAIYDLNFKMVLTRRTSSLLKSVTDKVTVTS